MNVRDLIKRALDAKEKAYSPYSNFKVGAALETDDDMVFTGCNIENAAFSPTNCAERTAFFKAVSEGKLHFKRLVVTGGLENYCYPCGVCRQVMQEFCDENEFEIIIAKDEDNYEVYKLKDLLPKSFKL